MWDYATRSDKPEDVGGQEVEIIQKEDFDKQVQREVERRMNIFLKQKRLREQLLKSSKRLTFRGSIKRSRLLWLMNMDGTISLSDGADDTITSQDSGSRISDQIPDELEGIDSKAYRDDLE